MTSVDVVPVGRPVGRQSGGFGLSEPVTSVHSTVQYREYSWCYLQLQSRRFDLSGGAVQGIGDRGGGRLDGGSPKQKF